MMTAPTDAIVTRELARPNRVDICMIPPDARIITNGIAGDKYRARSKMNGIDPSNMGTPQRTARELSKLESAAEYPVAPLIEAVRHITQKLCLVMSR